MVIKCLVTQFSSLGPPLVLAATSSSRSGSVRLLVFPSIRNPFLKYALQVKVQLGHASLGQVGSGGVSWGHVGLNGGRMGSRGNKRGSSQDRFEAKWGLVGIVDWLGE